MIFGPKPEMKKVEGFMIGSNSNFDVKIATNIGCKSSTENRIANGSFLRPTCRIPHHTQYLQHSTMFADESCIIYWLYTTQSKQIKHCDWGQAPKPHFSLYCNS